MAKVKITETVLRDSHQSLIATRMTTEEMLPIVEEMDKVEQTNTIQSALRKGATIITDAGKANLASRNKIAIIITVVCFRMFHTEK